MSETPESSISEMGIPQLDVRSLLVRHGVTAKKSWSQNFLLDERAYQSIVRACKLSPQDTAIEIGAGLGTLTSRLLQTGATVIAVERERDMCQVLRTGTAVGACGSKRITVESTRGAGKNAPRRTWQTSSGLANS